MYQNKKKSNNYESIIKIKTDFVNLLSWTATRETSFVHAISAAGVMYTLTRNCSLGDLDNCGCDRSKNGKMGEATLRGKKSSSCCIKGAQQPLKL